MGFTDVENTIEADGIILIDAETGARCSRVVLHRETSRTPYEVANRPTSYALCMNTKDGTLAVVTYDVVNRVEAYDTLTDLIASARKVRTIQAHTPVDAILKTLAAAVLVMGPALAEMARERAAANGPAP